MKVNSVEQIDWRAAAGELADQVRPETRSKYFPQNRLRQALIRRFLDRVGRGLSELEWNTLLDVGCGEGFVDYYLGRRFPGRAITGVEPDPEALAVARAINPGFSCLGADGRDLPFEDGRFDVAVCLEVLEHMRDFRSVMQELLRVSRRGVIISVPCWPWYQLTNFMIGKNWRRLGEHPDHVVMFTRHRLHSEMLRAFGATVVTNISFPWVIGRHERP